MKLTLSEFKQKVVDELLEESIDEMAENLLPAMYVDEIEMTVNVHPSQDENGETNIYVDDGEGTGKTVHQIKVKLSTKNRPESYRDSQKEKLKGELDELDELVKEISSKSLAGDPTTDAPPPLTKKVMAVIEEVKRIIFRVL